MQSRANTVDEYLSEVPEERKQVLCDVRKLIRTELPELHESMQCGAATYTRSGEEHAEIGFASQARYISIYFPVPVVEAKKHLLEGLNVGKCCVRYSSVKKVDLSVIKELLRETARQYRC